MTGSDGIEKKYSTSFSKKYHEVQLYVATTSDGTFYLGCSHEISLSQQPVPRHVARDGTNSYVCIWSVCVSCSVRWTPYSMQCCQVWWLQSAMLPILPCRYSVCNFLRVWHRCQTLRLQCCQVWWLQHCQTLWHYICHVFKSYV